MDTSKIVDTVSKLGCIGLLALIIIGGYQGMWVYGPTYRDVVSDRDEWKQLALRGTNLAVATSNSTVGDVKLGAQRPLPPAADKPQVRNVLDHLDELLKPYDNE